MNSSTKPLETKKRKWISTGAPSQKNQPTRKGKRAWRKNVDIQDVEAGLEGLREEEIATGGKLQDRRDKDLYQIDVVGDELARQIIQKEKKPLKFKQVLLQRSAVPAVFARPSSSAPKLAGKARFTPAEKSKLLQKAKRLRKGAFNSYLDPKESGSAVIERRKSAAYNVWEAAESDMTVRSDEALEYLVPIVEKPKVKAPESLLPSRHIDRAAVETPHSGLSYNPTYEAHQSLLKTAHDVEARREADENAWRGTKEQMEAMKLLEDGGDTAERFKGMMIDSPGDNEDVGQGDQPTEVAIIALNKSPARKTRQQKTKAARLRAEKHLLAEKAQRKKLATSLDAVRSITKETKRKLTTREALIVAKKLAAAKARRQSLAGRKIGRHIVKLGDIDVQLTDELSESLRALRPEGNLFKDRFFSMQQRALVEPRERVQPRKRKTKFKEYEKHPWKRFS